MVVPGVLSDTESMLRDFTSKASLLQASQSTVPVSATADADKSDEASVTAASETMDTGIAVEQFDSTIPPPPPTPPQLEPTIASHSAKASSSGTESGLDYATPRSNGSDHGVVAASEAQSPVENAAFTGDSDDAEAPADSIGDVAAEHVSVLQPGEQVTVEPTPVAESKDEPTAVESLPDNWAVKQPEVNNMLRFCAWSVVGHAVPIHQRLLGSSMLLGSAGAVFPMLPV